MAVEFRCVNPGCGKLLSGPDHWAGRVIHCPVCGVEQAVPGAPEPTLQQAAPPQPPDDDRTPGRLTLLRYALAARRGKILAVAGVLVLLGSVFLAFHMLSSKEPASPGNIGDSYLRSILSSKHKAEGLETLTNLKGLHKTLFLYALEHQGRFPPSLDDLVHAGLDPRALRVTRNSSEEFVYVPGLTNTDAAKIVVYAPKPDADGKRVVLRVGGSVEGLSEDAFHKQMAAQAPPSPPATRP